MAKISFAIDDLAKIYPEILQLAVLPRKKKKRLKKKIEKSIHLILSQLIAEHKDLVK